MEKVCRILICGAGGLGAPAAYQLTQAWNSAAQLSIRLIDPDSIERSNLNRQVFFADADRGKPKAKTLAAKLSLSAAKNVSFEARTIAFNSENAAELLTGVDYVIDATDSVPAKFLINDSCLKLGIPFSYAGVIGMGGQVLDVRPSSDEHSACLRCLFSGLSEGELAAENTTCRQAGIIGPVAGYIGALQARLAIDALTSATSGTDSTLYRFSALNTELKISKVSPNADCPHCSAAQRLDLRDKRCPETFLYTKLALEQLPGGGRLIVNFGNPDSLKNVSQTLSEDGYKISTTAQPAENLFELEIIK